jgi:hypothetical protein
MERDALPAYPAYRPAATALLTAAGAPGPVDLAAVVATLFTAPEPGDSVGEPGIEPAHRRKR